MVKHEKMDRDGVLLADFGGKRLRPCGVKLAPFLAKPVEQVLIADEFAGEDFGSALSSYSKTLAMKDCFRIVLAYSDFDMIEETTRNVVSKCADRASQIVADTPTDSFAWLRARRSLGSPA